MKTLLKFLYVPLMLVGFYAAALGLIRSGHSHFWLLALLMLAITVSFLTERIIPYNDAWNSDLDDSNRDVAHALVNELSAMLSVLSIPLLSLLAPWPEFWPSHWPLLAQLLIAIVVADFGITLCHYFSHRYELLWRFHAVHHSVKRMYGFNGLMKHPLHQTLETIAGTTPLMLIGMPFEIGALLGFAIALQLLLQHSNTDMRIGPLRHLLALAPVHRFHHRKWAGIGDVNFGLFLTIWDRLLGTAHYEHEASFTSDDLGIGKQPDYPTRYPAQLLAPFKKQPVQYSKTT